MSQADDRDPTWPGRYYLFGEWLNATHAIAYDGLPDRFIAFDLYDRAYGGRFLTRVAVERLLAAFCPSMVLAPVLQTCTDGRVPCKEALVALASGTSAFGERADRIAGLTSVTVFGNIGS